MARLSRHWSHYPRADHSRLRASRRRWPLWRREKEQREMVQAARRGDVVVTTGGLIGKVTKSVDDNEVEFEIAPNVRARLARSGIAEVRAKGEPVKDAAPPAKSLPAKKDAPNP